MTKKNATVKTAAKRVLVKDYNAITTNVKAQDGKLSHIDRITAEVGTMRIALAAIIFTHVKPGIKTPKEKQAEGTRLIALAKSQIAADGYTIQHDKALWSTVTNALNLHLFPEVVINVEDKIVDGKQTFKKAKAADVLKMPARKVNTSASSLKVAAKIADKRSANTSANKTANKAKRAARLPQENRKAATTIKESGWSASIKTAFEHTESSAALVQAIMANKQKFILAMNKAGYSVAITSVVPTAKVKPTAKGKAKASPAQRKIPAAALKAAAKR